MDSIERDNQMMKKLFVEVNTKRDELNVLETEYERIKQVNSEINNEVKGWFSKSLVPTIDGVEKAIEHGLECLGTIQVRFEPEGEYGELNRNFRIQGGKMYNYRKQHEAYHQLIPRLLMYGGRISKEIKNPDLRADFDRFRAFCVDNKRVLMGINDTDRSGTAEEWFGIKPRVLCYNQVDNYNSNNWRGSTKVEEFSPTVTAIKVNHEYRGQLELRCERGGEEGVLSMDFYDHVVQQLMPELKELKENRDKLRLETAKFEIELADKVNECFGKWLVLQQI